MKKLFEFQDKIDHCCITPTGGVAFALGDAGGRRFGVGVVYSEESDYLETLYNAGVPEFDLDSKNFEGECYIDTHIFDTPAMLYNGGKLETIAMGIRTKPGRANVNGKAVSFGRTYEHLYLTAELDFGANRGTVVVYGLKDGEDASFEGAA